MSYVTPVTDRTFSDIAAKNSKAYFNVADWTRIYRNGQIVVRIAGISSAGDIDYFSYPIIGTPSTTSFPLATDINNVMSSINDVLNDFAYGGTLLKENWIAGVGEASPTYIDVNLWESAIDWIWGRVSGSSYDVCPTLTGDLTLSADYIVIDCIDTNGHTLNTNGNRFHII